MGKRFGVLGMLLILTISLCATNYYLSEKGSDDNSGLSDMNAWNTLKQIDLKIKDGTIKNGDSILLRGGDTFRASQINITQGINFSSYGGGEKPMITGLEVLKDFIQKNDTLFYKVLNRESVNFLIFDTKIKQKGAFPNYSLNNKLTSVNEDTIVDELFNNRDFTGGELVLKLNEWTLRVIPIVRHVNGSLLVSKQFGKPETGDGWFIQNDIEVFTENGDWAFNMDTLWMHCEDEIRNHRIQISITQTLFNLVSDYNITVSNIQIVGIEKYAINLNGTGNITVHNVDIRKSTCGIVGNLKAERLNVKECSFEDIFGDAISYYGRPDSAIISNCSFDRVGVYTGVGGNFRKHRYSAIEGGVLNYGEVTYSKVKDVGYNGIGLASKFGSVHIRYNYIEDTNKVLIDGAAIYPGNQSVLDTVFVYKNIIFRGERGIYQDYGNQRYQVYDNLIADCSYSGYYCNDAKRSDIYHNTFFNNETNIKIQQWADSTTLGYVNDLKIFDNITYTSKEWRYHFTYGLGSINTESVDWESVGFGHLNDNYIIAWEDNKIARITGGNVKKHNEYLWFDDLKAKGYEENSSLIIESHPQLIYNATLKDSLIDLQTPVSDVYGEIYTTNVLLEPFTSKVLLPLKEENMSYALVKGWNNIVFPVEPANGSPKIVFKSIIDQNKLIKVQTENGSTLEKHGQDIWASDMDKITAGTGCRVQVTEACSLEVEGYHAIKTKPVTLKKGWNLMPYYVTESMDGLEVLTACHLLDKLVVLQDEEGRTIRQLQDGSWQNNIGQFRPGKSYEIKLNEDCSFVYKE